MVIGICDDSHGDITILSELCTTILEPILLNYSIQTFHNGKELIRYCNDVNHIQIDLLFLDIEMSGINGVDLMPFLLECEMVSKIVYVTSHDEYMKECFSEKTVGFIQKPPVSVEVEKVIRKVQSAYNNQMIDFPNNKEILTINTKDIIYLKAEGSYTRVFYHVQSEGVKEYLTSKKLGVLEEILLPYSFQRIHKSYIINFNMLKSARVNVLMKYIENSLPVGRNFHEKLVQRIHENTRIL